MDWSSFFSGVGAVVCAAGVLIIGLWMGMWLKGGWW